MRIDMPTCSFSYCRAYMDGNCHAIATRRETCEFKAMNETAEEAIKMLTPAESDGSRAVERARRKLITLKG